MGQLRKFEYVLYIRWNYYKGGFCSSRVCGWALMEERLTPKPIVGAPTAGVALTSFEGMHFGSTHEPEVELRLSSLLVLPQQRRVG